jgi:hypothetical protein
VGAEIFCSRPDRPWAPPSLLHNGYRVSFPGRGVDHPPPSSAEVKERVELYLYSPSGPSWPVLGRTLPLPLPFVTWVCNPRPAIVYYATRARICKLWKLHSNFSSWVYDPLLILHVRPAAQPTVTGVALCHIKVGHQWFIRFRMYNNIKRIARIFKSMPVFDYFR